MARYQQFASVEITSEDPKFPIESALAGGEAGWRAAEKQTDDPTRP